MALQDFARPAHNQPLGLAAIFSGLFRRPAAPDRAAAMKAAVQARCDALAAYAEAKRRGDTRDINAAHKVLRTATTDLVRLELGGGLTQAVRP